MEDSTISGKPNALWDLPTRKIERELGARAPASRLDDDERITGSELDVAQMIGTPPRDSQAERIRNGAAARLFGSSAKDDEAKKIGKYRVLRRLGVGGMGEVYLAHDPVLKRDIALKILRDRGAAIFDEASARLQREAQALAQLSHSHVTQVYEVACHNGQLFVAMEYVEGANLGVWTATRIRTWRETLAVYLEAGRGLAVAHDAGLVHRDFKPENVLIRDDGGVKVADFGLSYAPEMIQRAHVGALHIEPDAKTVDELDPLLEERLTQAGAVMGTIRYMSPEQLRGEPADARSDQFSFCVALYDALFGQYPFETTSSGAATDQDSDTSASTVLTLGGLGIEQTLGFALLRGALREPPRDSKVPAYIARALARGLAKEPEKRFASMDGLLAALEDDPWPRRQRWLGGGAMASVLIGTSSYAYSKSIQPEPCSGTAEEFDDTWNPARSDAVVRAFRASGLEYRESTLKTTISALDTYAAAWAAIRTESCEATRIHASQSEAIMAQRTACLDRQRQRVDSLVSQLERATGPVVENAPLLLAELAAPATCGGQELMRRSCNLLPEGVDDGEFRRHISASQAHELLGDYPSAIEAARASIDEALSMEIPSLLASGALQLGRLLAETDPSEAAVVLARAYDAAERAGCDGTVADIASHQVKLIALNPGLPPANGRLWSTVQFAKVSRSGGDVRRAAAHNDRGLLAVHTGDGSSATLEGARDDYKVGLKLRESTLGERHLEVANSYLNLGVVEAQIGSTRVGVEHIERAHEIFAEALGAEHPKTLMVFGDLLVESGPELARAYFERALERARESYGDDSVPVARIHTRLALAAQIERDFENALEHARRADAIIVRVAGPNDLERRDTLDAVAQLLTALEQFDEASVVFQQVVKLVEGNKRAVPDIERALARSRLAFALTESGELAEALSHSTSAMSEASLTSAVPTAVDQAEILINHGYVLLKLGRLEEAVSPLERSLSLIASSPLEEMLAYNRWFLAEALCFAPDRAERARELALQARAWFVAGAEARDSEVTLEIDSWLVSACVGQPSLDVSRGKTQN